jgi:hypothetical protein
MIDHGHPNHIPKNIIDSDLKIFSIKIDDLSTSVEDTSETRMLQPDEPKI